MRVTDEFAQQVVSIATKAESAMTNQVQFNNVMLDIETLGKSPGCVVMQIAAVPFCLERQGDYQPDEVQAWKDANCRLPWEGFLNSADQVARGFKIDPDTLQFWLNEHRRNMFASLFRTDNAVDTLAALREFGEYITTIGKNALIWTRGIDFDIPILARLFEEYKVPIPWGYNKKVDVRSYIRAAFGDKSPQRRYYFGASHDAVVDCYNQIQDVQAVYAQIHGVPDARSSVSGLWRTDAPPKDGTDFLAELNGNTMQVVYYDDDHRDHPWAVQDSGISYAPHAITRWMLIPRATLSEALKP